MPGLGVSFGRGGATTNLMDLANADCLVIEGSDFAECHPVGFRFVMEAKARGATIIHVDPRYTRTSALSNMYVPIRAGTDIAFLGGLINYVIQNDLYFHDYVVAYTNAPAIVEAAFQGTEDLDGLFSGFDAQAGEYVEIGSWLYEGMKVQSLDGMSSETHTTQSFGPRAGQLMGGPPRQDPTLQHPRSVFQIVKRHFSRYTPEMVEQICGTPRDLFLRVAEAITRNSGRERTTAFCYAVGWTQHTTGVQLIRAASILQLLLGNIGRPGGGIQALRGHATIQGSTDIPTLYDLLPGYLSQPRAHPAHSSLSKYLQMEGSRTGYWANTPKYLVSLLKAWYGESANAENEFCYHHLPKIESDYSQLPMMLAMKDGKIKGFFLMGQNPAVGSADAKLVRSALANVDWMVVRDLYENETSAFWYKSPEVARGEMRPSDIKTEVFFLPAAGVAEKDGSFTNTQRLIQWHDKAVEPPGDARSELWFLYELGRRLKALYADSARAKDRSLLDLTWDYRTTGPYGEPVAEDILREINGFFVGPRGEERRQVKDFTELKDDGSTACGCWIYSGIFPESLGNRARSRQPDPPGVKASHQNWGFAWPLNRRILYNRASADPHGRPWSENKAYVWWNADTGHWTGSDAPDFPDTKAPDTPANWEAGGMDAHSGAEPFIMKSDGRGWLYAPTGLRDGPLPVHYEPAESPVKNHLYSQQQSPTAKIWRRPENPIAPTGDPHFPYVITTYRLTEHHTGGTMTRWLSWLSELQPQGFVEISPELGEEKGIRNGDWVTVSSPRGEVEARALVTGRMRPLNIDGHVIHQVGMPWHFGYVGLARGDVANTLTAIVGDPNVSIHEGKVFVCNIRAGRKEAP